MGHDPVLWYTITFLIFCGVAWRYARKPALGWLDGQIEKIRAELAQAQKLRAEAEAALAEYKQKQAAAMAEAEQIIRHAKEEAASLKAMAEADLKETLARHERQAMERIRLAEVEALRDVRAAAIDMALSLARETLAEHMDAANATRLVEQAIDDLPKLAAAKAKAA